MTSSILSYLDYVVFLSCSRARKKRKIWYKPSDDFLCIFYLNCIVVLSCSLARKSASFGTSLVMTPFVFCYLNYIVFLQDLVYLNNGVVL